MANLTAVLIFGATVSGILFILDIILLILSAVRLKKATCSLLFANMTTFTIAQLVGFIFYLAGATDENVTDGTFSKSQDPPRILMYLFYLTSITLLLFVWVNRIKSTFQETQWAYDAKLMKTIYILISIVPFLQFGIIISAITVTVIQKDPTPGNNPIYKLMMVFAALYLLFVICLSLFLSYLFIKRCILLAKFKLEIEISGASDSNNDLVYKLLKIQTKLTILVLVAITSTFCTIILNLIFNTVLPASGVQLSAIWTNIDTFLNFNCIAFILKQNENIYSKLCKPCIYCFNVMNSSVQAPLNTHPNANTADSQKPVASLSILTSTKDPVNGSTGSGDSNGSGVAKTPTPQTYQTNTEITAEVTAETTQEQTQTI